MSESVYVKFEDLSRPIQLSNCRSLIEHFPLIFAGWKYIELPTTDQSPIITITLDRNGDYRLKAEWLEKTSKYDDEVDTVCALVARLVKARVLEDMNLLCLHGAAVEMGGELIIFPNRYRAGKSVLSVCLAAAGFKLYSDDVLPISLATGEGIAPGIAPRLRAPYPDNLSDAARKFIESRAVLQGKRYHYLDLRRDMLAPRDRRAPIGAFVFLERSEGAAAELQPASEAEVLRQVVWQNFAREVDAPRILSRLGQVVNNSRGFRLRYDSADDAVALLKRTFGHQKPPAPSVSQRDIEMHSPQTAKNDVPPGCLQRKHGISEITTDGDAFLADANGAAIHHLNAVGSAIWNLLAEPITIEQIIELLLVAFPEAEAGQVERDVRKLIRTLNSKKLLVEGPGHAGSSDSA